MAILRLTKIDEELQGTLMVSDKILIFFSFCPFKLLNKNMEMPKMPNGNAKFCDTEKYWQVTLSDLYCHKCKRYRQ